ncbi:MlaE family lipid ABC transporter permease subunit [Aurantimonas aggregata]|uniref:MlaE family lipid ABC transporter permease subunit n=1 Tax=Aurantimonas aggregata TaxID=2047720 RepID=A0A6L9MBP4_9HYPH|nr:ABC transporter permease [Aurantimonas aggregata]NDV85213.1 MlaE family lipid ABC transporter permease subunit [Aurantimonas aggregata]
MPESSPARTAGATGRRHAVPPALDREQRDGRVVLKATGDWLARTVGSLEQTVGDVGKSDAASSAVVDCGSIGRIDTAGAFVIERLARDLGGQSKLEGVAERDTALFDAVRRAMDAERPDVVAPKGNVLAGLLDAVGRGVVSMYDEIVIALNIIGGAIFGAGRRLSGRTQIRSAAIFNQIDQMGVKAVPIIMLMSFLIGAIIAQQGAFQLRRFGGEVYAVNLISILVLREIGVLLTAIMIAGRSGSAITAEIGSMKMREEVDALQVIGLNPIGVLVFPRLVALTIALPLLTVLANLSALLGGMLVLNVYSGISTANFIQGMQSSIDLFTVFSGLIKAPFMAIIIGLVASSEGMKVGGSAESLGLHVTAAVVKAIFLVILMDGIFAIFYASIGL